MKKTDICLVGAINHDRVITFEGLEGTGFGGLLYNILPLSALFGESARIRPFSKVGKEHIGEVQAMLKPCENVDAEGIAVSPEGTNEVVLTYVAPDRRTETLKSRIGQFKYEEITLCVDCDILLFNFTSGFAIPLDTLRRVKEASRALVLVDVHSKILGMKEDGSRFPQAWDDWEDWLCHADIVQMSKDECALVVGEGLETDQDYIDAAARIMDVGPSRALVTFGSKGVLAAYREDGKYYHAKIPATSHQPVDTTGCGDSFAAGYMYGMALGLPPLGAAALANVVAGENCTTQGKFASMKGSEAVEGMKREYPGLLKRIAAGWKGTEA